MVTRGRHAGLKVCCHGRRFFLSRAWLPWPDTTAGAPPRPTSDHTTTTAAAAAAAPSHAHALHDARIPSDSRRSGGSTAAAAAARSAASGGIGAAIAASEWAKQQQHLQQQRGVPTHLPRPLAAPRAPPQPTLLSVESVFLGCMQLRDRLMSRGAHAQPDTSAKDEALSSALQGREHPAATAYRNGRCATIRDQCAWTCSRRSLGLLVVALIAHFMSPWQLLHPVALISVRLM